MYHSLHEDVFMFVANSQVHRLVVVDKTDRCIGVVSLSDILKFLVLKPAGMAQIVIDAAMLRSLGNTESIWWYHFLKLNIILKYITLGARGFLREEP